MPRGHIRKTSRGLGKEEIELAAAEVMKGQISCNKIAHEFGVSRSSLSRYCSKIKSNLTPKFGYVAPNRVFNEDQEREIVEYLQRAAEIYFGLTIKDARKLIYEVALIKNLKYPNQWKEIGMTTVNWIKNFLKRHQNLSIWSPQGTSLSRATSFNKTNVNLFFDNLQKIMEIHSINNNPSTSNNNVNNINNINNINNNSSTSNNNVNNINNPSNSNNSLIHTTNNPENSLYLSQLSQQIEFHRSILRRLEHQYEQQLLINQQQQQQQQEQQQEQQQQEKENSLNLEVNFPFPKAGPRKETNRGRKRRKSAILTDSPTRNQISEEKLSKKVKKPSKAIKVPIPKKELKGTNSNEK